MNPTIDAMLKLIDTCEMLHWIEQSVDISDFTVIFGPVLGGHLLFKWGLANREILPFINNSLDETNRTTFCTYILRKWNQFKLQRHLFTNY